MANYMIFMQINESGRQKNRMRCWNAWNWKHYHDKDREDYKQLTERKTILKKTWHRFLQARVSSLLDCGIPNWDPIDLSWDLCTGWSNSALMFAMPMEVGAEKPNHYHYFPCCATRKELLKPENCRQFGFVYVKSSSPWGAGSRVELLCTTVWHSVF